MNKLLFVVIQCLVFVNSRPTEEQIKNIFGTNTRLNDTLSNLWDNVMDYNENKVKQLLPKYPNLLPLFGKVVDLPKTTIETRFGIGEANNMCTTRTATMFPRKGLTIDGGMKHIVNVPGYHQTVTFQACADGALCYAGEDYLPIGVKSFCETQFIIIRLVVINEDNTLSLDQFEIPSGCSCMYQTD